MSILKEKDPLDPMYDLRGPTYLVGDVHGEFARLENYLNNLESRNIITPGNLIMLGDIGLGFGNKLWEFQNMCERLSKSEWKVFALRGNHDDPSCWWGKSAATHPALPRWLKDNSVISINGQLFLICGGGVSIDQNLRTPGISWWEGEEIFISPSTVRQYQDKVYGLLTHVGPRPPLIPSLVELDPGTEMALEREAGQLRRLTEIRPKIWLYGHFHCSAMFDYQNNIRCCCLDIMEIRDLADFMPKNIEE